jgi:hypothetical protein
MIITGNEDSGYKVTYNDMKYDLTPLSSCPNYYCISVNDYITPIGDVYYFKRTDKGFIPCKIEGNIEYLFG